MSAVNIETLRASAKEGAKNNEEYMKKKEMRIEECKKQLNEKLEECVKKYFDDENKFSINSSLDRACKKNGHRNEVELYMNFDRQDFVEWNKFVPFKADKYGKNYNARPSTCLHMFLTYSHEQGYLPENISFDVWGNKKFTVKFTISLQDTNKVEAKTLSIS